MPSDNVVSVQIIDLRSAVLRFGHIFDDIVVNSVSRSISSTSFNSVSPVPITVTRTHLEICSPQLLGSLTGCILALSLIGLDSLINAFERTVLLVENSINYIRFSLILGILGMDTNRYRVPYYHCQRISGKCKHSLVLCAISFSDTVHFRQCQGMHRAHSFPQHNGRPSKSN